MELTNAEFVLLQIVCERSMVSGYEINQLIRDWGYKEWAEIGTTSIYVGLNKLSKKKLVYSYIDTEKQGRGPVPRKFEVTAAGRAVLQEETIAALSSSRERDFRFDLALAAIPFVDKEAVVAALRQRETLLAEVAEDYRQKVEALKKRRVPVNLQALYQHPLVLIKNEIEFMDNLIQNLLEKQ